MRGSCREVKRVFSASSAPMDPMDSRREWSVPECLALPLDPRERVDQAISVVMANLENAGVSADVRQEAQDDVQAIADWIFDI